MKNRVLIFTVLLLSVVLLLPTVVQAGSVRMSQEGIPKAWVVRDENGAILQTPGTQCEGLPEALEYARNNGHSFYLEAGGAIAGPPPRNESILVCQQPIIFPAMQNAVIFMESVTLNFPPGVSGPGIEFDSCIGCHITINGQISHAGSGPAIIFRPQDPAPLDAFAGPTINDSSFIIGSAVTEPGGGQSGGATVVLFDVSSGPVSNNIFVFNEINSQEQTFHGILVGGGPSGFFFSNDIACLHLHNSLGMEVNVASGGTNTYGNKWNLMIQPGEGGGGFYTQGDNDQIELTVLNSQAQPGGLGMESLKLDTSSDSNKVMVRLLQGTAGIPLCTNNGTNNLIVGASC